MDKATSFFKITSLDGFRIHVNEFLSYCEYECFFSKHTYSSYSVDLNQFISFNRFNHNFLDHSKLFIQWIFNRQYSDKSILRKLSTLKSFFKYLINDHIISDDFLLLIPEFQSCETLPYILSQKNINTLLQQPDISSYKGLRDKVLLECLYSTGLRVSECMNLKVSDINFQSKWLKVLGKGSKYRLVPLTNQMCYFLKTFIQKKSFSEYIFHSQKNNSISRQTMFNIVKKYSKKAGLDFRYISPHTFRHAFATHLIEGSARLRDVQLLLGHQHVSSTQVYTKLSNKFVQDTYLQAHPRATL